MKLRYQYRIYLTDQQGRSLAQMFGCTRVVWNDALNHCQENYKNGKKYCEFSELSNRFLTQAKNIESRQWLRDTPSVPLQQSLRYLD